MKKSKMFLSLLLIAALAFVPVAYAAFGVYNSGTNLGQANDVNYGSGLTVSVAGGIATVAATAAAITSGTISGVTIENSAIGGVTPAAGAFTTLGATGASTLTGNVTFGGAVIGSTEAVTTSAADPGVGVASIANGTTFVTTDDTGVAPDEITLADGVIGQEKRIQLVVDGEVAGLSVIPANFAGGTAILLEDVEDVVELVFDGTDWHLTQNIGGTVS